MCRPNNVIRLLRYFFVLLFFIYSFPDLANADSESSFKVTLLSDDTSGYLVITNSALFFRDKKMNEMELVQLQDIIGYNVIDNTNFIVFAEDGRQFAFKVNRRDNVFDEIEKARARYYSSAMMPKPEMKVSGQVLLVDGYANIMGKIAPIDKTKPDLIITESTEIIESVVYMISEEEIVFSEYPLEEKEPQLSLPIASVRKVSLHNGEVLDFSENADTLNTELAANNDILRTKGVWILNRDNQKLTYETIKRYFTEEEISQYRHYHRKGEAGKTIMWIGGGILIFDGVLYSLNVVDKMIDDNKSGPIIAYGISIAIGVGLAVVGGLISSRARKDLASYVAEWNAQQKISITTGVSFGKTSNGYGIAFNF